MNPPQDVQDCLELIRRWNERNNNPRPAPPAPRPPRPPPRPPRGKRKKDVDCEELLDRLQQQTVLRDLIDADIRNINDEGRRVLAEAEAELDRQDAAINRAVDRRNTVNARIAALQLQYDENCTETERRPSRRPRLQAIECGRRQRESNPEGRLVRRRM